MWWLGDYYYRHDDLIMARRYFSSIIQDFPKSNLVADAYYALGSLLEEESKHEEAAVNFKKVAEFGKSDLAGQAAIAIAKIYVKEDKIDLAIQAYEGTLKDYPNLSGIIYLQMADVFYKTDDLSRSLEFYRKSLDLVPLKQMPGIQLRIAEVLEAQGKVNEAIEEYFKATYLFPEDNVLARKAFLRVAAIYEGKHSYKEALVIYKKVSSMNAEESKYAKERIEWINKNVR